jgi:hypothetical protein
MDSETMIKGSFEATKDPLDKKKMGLTGIMHMETDLLHGIRDFRSRVSFVL